MGFECFLSGLNYGVPSLIWVDVVSLTHITSHLEVGLIVLLQPLPHADEGHSFQMMITIRETHHQ